MSELDEISGMPGRRPGTLAVILWAIVTSAAVSIGIAYAQHFVALPGLEPVVVEHPAPDLTAISVEAARRLASAYELTIEMGEPRESAEVPEGDVIEQVPEVGEQIAAGEAIMIIVSSGPPKVEVPDVRRRSLADARVALETSGLVPGAVTEGEGEAGTVTATDPVAGTEVPPGTTVALTAVPEAPPGIEVPDLSSMRLSEARRALTEAGLEVGRVRRRYDDRRGPNVVISQDPDPGTRVEAGAEVAIVANEGV